MEQKEQEYIEIDIMHLLGKLWQSRLVILFTVILFAVSTLLVNLFLIAPKYQSTTKIYVVNQTENKTITTQDLQLGNFLVKDYKEIILSEAVMAQVIQSEKLELSTGQLAKTVSVDSPKDTRILSITVSNRDAEEASHLANKIREVAAEQIKRVTKVNDVTTLEEAKPSVAKSSPKVTRNTVLAAALGFVLSAGVILVKELLDDRVRRPEDVEDYMDMVLLGIVPNVNMKDK